MISPGRWLGHLNSRAKKKKTPEPQGKNQGMFKSKNCIHKDAPTYCFLKYRNKQYFFPPSTEINNSKCIITHFPTDCIHRKQTRRKESSFTLLSWITFFAWKILQVEDNFACLNYNLQFVAHYTCTLDYSPWWGIEKLSQDLQHSLHQYEFLKRSLRLSKGMSNQLWFIILPQTHKNITTLLWLSFLFREKLFF